MEIERSNAPYYRNAVENDSENMYIFTDNTDRNSGKGNISADSWYSKKYGTSKHYPTMTSALIRGLNNAFPITTQRYYNSEKKGNSGRWTDDDIEEFAAVINDDFEEIIKNAPRFKKIIFPPGGIFNSKIANISRERTPKLYDFLWEKCKTLLELSTTHE